MIAAELELEAKMLLGFMEQVDKLGTPPALARAVKERMILSSFLTVLGVNGEEQVIRPQEET